MYPYKKVSCMEIFKHENDIFMHKNDISMHKNDISMHENEIKFSSDIGLYTISCMEFSSVKTLRQNFHFHAWKFHFHE